VTRAVQPLSILIERLHMAYDVPGGCPRTSHAVVVVEVCGGPEVATVSRLLRGHFPAVEAIGHLGGARFAVLVRRHPGLDPTLERLRLRLAFACDPGGRLAVWCEQLPASPASIAGFVDLLRHVEPSDEAGDIEPVDGGAVVVPVDGGAVVVPLTAVRPPTPPRWRGTLVAPIAAAAAAALVLSAGLTARGYAPWFGATRTTSSSTPTRDTTSSAVERGRSAPVGHDLGLSLDGSLQVLAERLRQVSAIVGRLGRLARDADRRDDESSQTAPVPEVTPESVLAGGPGNGVAESGDGGPTLPPPADPIDPESPTTPGPPEPPTTPPDPATPLPEPPIPPDPEPPVPPDPEPPVPPDPEPPVPPDPPAPPEPPDPPDPGPWLPTLPSAPWAPPAGDVPSVLPPG
jgi:hypothetical protein